jgi:hypothetical protein
MLLQFVLDSGDSSILTIVSVGESLHFLILAVSVHQHFFIEDHIASAEVIEHVLSVSVADLEFAEYINKGVLGGT